MRISNSSIFSHPVAELDEKNRVLEDVKPKFYTLPSWAKKGHKARVKWLRQFAEEYAMDPRLRWFVVDEVLKPAGVRSRDFPQMAKVLLAWVQRNIYYTMEAGEQLQSPSRTLQVGTGDCDDSAVLLAAMAAAVGLPNKLVLAGRRPNGALVRWVEGVGSPPKASYFHIYCLLGWPAGAPHTWAPAEQTLQGAPLGYDMVLHGLSVDAVGRPSVPADGRDYLAEVIASSGRSGAHPEASLGSFIGESVGIIKWVKQPLEGVSNGAHLGHLLGAALIGAGAVLFYLRRR